MQAHPNLDEIYGEILIDGKAHALSHILKFLISVFSSAPPNFILFFTLHNTKIFQTSLNVYSTFISQNKSSFLNQDKE